MTADEIARLWSTCIVVAARSSSQEQQPDVQVFARALLARARRDALIEAAAVCEELSAHPVHWGVDKANKCAIEIRALM